MNTKYIFPFKVSCVVGRRCRYGLMSMFSESPEAQRNECGYDPFPTDRRFSQYKDLPKTLQEQVKFSFDTQEF